MNDIGKEEYEKYIETAEGALTLINLQEVASSIKKVSLNEDWHTIEFRSMFIKKFVRILIGLESFSNSKE